ncbi:MAG: hypothetical protein ACI88C_000002 [Acidimicrobiales bacterium]|jgi:hypothetical protein
MTTLAYSQRQNIESAAALVPGMLACCGTLLLQEAIGILMAAAACDRGTACDAVRLTADRGGISSTYDRTAQQWRISR